MSSAIGALLWCMAGAGAAGARDGSVLGPASAQVTDAARAAPRAEAGEAFSWQPLVRGPAPGVDLGSVPARARAALERAVAATAAGRYQDAVAAGEQALQALEAAPSVKPQDLARILVWLGGVDWLGGDLARAELLLRRGLAMLEAALGTSHPEVAAARNGLAIVYQAEGLPGQAEPLHQRALSMQQSVLGPDHLDVATSLINLAILYKSQGMYERARPLYERALAIQKKALGEEHPAVAESLADLAALHQAQGLHARSEELLRRALAIQEKALGEGHPSIASSLSHLSAVYSSQARYAEAEPLEQRALAIRKEALGEGHPAVASSLSALAALALAKGDAALAEPSARRALAIREATLSEHHPEVAASLEQVAQVSLMQHRLDDALPLLWRSFTLSETRLRREGLDFSEQRLSNFLQLLRASEERFYMLLRAYPDDPRVQRLVLAVALLRKGRSVEETANTSRVVYRSLSPLDRDTFERLRALRSQLARVSLAGPGPLDPGGYQRQMGDLTDRGDTLEAKLARRSSRLRAVTALPSPTEIVDRVAAALPKDGALIELVEYADRARGAADAKGAAPLRYLALVLAPGARTRAVDLGPAEPLDEVVAHLRAALASRDAAYQGLAQQLDALLFEPLRPLLGDARRLFVSPDGQLALVPFAALHDGRSFLLDTFDFTYLTSGKDLLPRTADVPRSRSVVVLADPDFAARPGAPSQPPGEVRSAAERNYVLPRPDASTLRADLAGQTWVPLPGTRREAEAIRTLFPRAQVFVGAEATKDRLLHVAAPGILHVATHGFFLEDAAAAVQGDRGLTATGPTGGPNRLSGSANPLLRSGLVLAGAQSAEAAGDAAQVPLDSTLVTALELAGADMWGTQLVVLSACDTGQGDIKLGQGVYGLRRALVAAGAETVVMTLWKVNDDATHELMESYYRNLLAGQGRTAALRAAMQALRATQSHPYFWAPFISSGNDAPLVMAPVE